MLRARLTYANVMSTLAVFIALGGASYAAINLPARSVGTRQLKAHAVTGTRLATGAVTRSKVKANTLTGGQIKELTLGPVPNAAQATNAGTLGGQSAAQLLATAKLRCPAGTAFGGGECVETSRRAADTWFGAIGACFVAGRQLPTVLELEKTDGTGVEWTSEVASVPSNVFTVGLQFGTIGVADGGSATVLPFRCVQHPTN